MLFGFALGDSVQKYGSPPGEPMVHGKIFKHSRLPETLEPQMSNFLLQFNYRLVEEAQKDFDSGLVESPLNWVAKQQLKGTVRQANGRKHVCGLLFSEDKNSLNGTFCTCSSIDRAFRPPSHNPCKHILAVLIAYENNPDGVITVAGETTNPPTTNKKSAPRAPLKKSSANSKKLKYVDQASAYQTLELSAEIKSALDKIAADFEELRSLEDMRNIPDMVYLICDGAPGDMPDFKIYLLKDGQKENAILVPEKSPLWLKASLKQRSINTLRKMIFDGRKGNLSYLDRWVYGSLWLFLLKTCLSTGRCYFDTLELPPLSPGPDIKNIQISVRTIKETRKAETFMRTADGAFLRPWLFPFYVDRQAGRAGEALVSNWVSWYYAFWQPATAPLMELAKLGGLLIGQVDGYSLSTHFPHIFEALADGNKMLLRPETSNLCYTLETSVSKPVPELKAWTKEIDSNGKEKSVQISWEAVAREGSIRQQFIARSYEKFLKHSGQKEIENMTVCSELWIEFIQFIVGTGKCYWKQPHNGAPLSRGPALNGVTHWHKNLLTKQADFSVRVREADGSLVFICPWFLPIYVNESTNKLGTALRLPSCKPLLSLLALGTIPLSMETAVNNYVRKLKLENIVGLLNKDTQWHDFIPAAKLEVLEENKARVLSICFEGKESSIEKNGITHIRTMDRSWVEKILDQFKTMGFDSYKDTEQPLTFRMVPKTESCWQQLLTEFKTLRKAGLTISHSTELNLRPLNLTADKFVLGAEDNGKSAGWFSMSLKIKVDDEEINLLPILISAIRSLPEINETSIETLNQNGKYIARLKSGRLAAMPFDRIKLILLSLRELLPKVGSESNEGLGVTTAHVVSILNNKLFTESEKRISETLKETSRKSQLLQELKPLAPSANLKTTLREYQKTGLGWLDQISKLKVGGILADEMGLGKTVQVIAKIALDKSRNQQCMPVLIVCPASLVGNWTNEILKFAPDLQVMQYVGSGRQKLQAYFKFTDVVLTTYQIMLRDQAILTDEWWHGVFLDEAQSIKNSAAAITAAAKELVADYKICLTGTPIENHLGELWSLFDFLMPGLLGSRARFTKFIQRPAEAGDKMAATMLRQTVEPFVLRRVKEDVLKELPEKIESIVRVELTAKQADLYETARLLANEELRQEIVSRNFSPRSPRTIEIVTRLRQVCLHPALCKLDAAKVVDAGGKFAELFERIADFLVKGRKLLIFSQYVEMLKLISDELTLRTVPFLKLIGDLPIDERTRMVQQFQESDVQIFLISLLAGGYGLNLTKADTVVIYDPWWNPAKEEQAIDRAHRIGQSNPVSVLRMIAAGTIEERMIELKVRKQAISSLIYSEEEFLKELTEEDILSLLSPQSTQ